eukprot:1524252-Pyramimonas_sp.AAC.1
MGKKRSFRSNLGDHLNLGNRQSETAEPAAEDGHLRNRLTSLRPIDQRVECLQRSIAGLKKAAQEYRDTIAKLKDEVTGLRTELILSPKLHTIMMHDDGDLESYKD